jgi:hypothetical protein
VQETNETKEEWGKFQLEKLLKKKEKRKILLNDLDKIVTLIIIFKIF